MRRNEHPAVTITLSPSQVAEIVRTASATGGPGIDALLARASAGKPAVNGSRARTATHADGNADRARGSAGDSGGLDGADGRLSLSLLRGIALLAAFEESRERGIVEVARELKMSPSTTHRYVQTLLELGLLERDPRTRKYSLRRPG